jgi:hypothetical protein
VGSSGAVSQPCNESLPAACKHQRQSPMSQAVFLLLLAQVLQVLACSRAAFRMLGFFAVPAAMCL